MNETPTEANLTAGTGVGAELQRARKASGLTQREAAVAVGRDTQTISRWERGEQVPSKGDVALLMAIYGQGGEIGSATSRNVSRGTFVGEPSATYGSEDAWSPNPALSNAIPPRAYEVAVGYCRRLVAAGLDRDEVEALERVMIDSRYAKANKRAGRDLSDDDWILLVDDVWDAIRETLAGRGVRV